MKAFNDGAGKQPATGASVAVVRSVAYNPDEAEQWARVNAPNLLILDGTRFEKGVKDGMLRNAPATITEHPTAKIAKDLSDYLPYQGDRDTNGADPYGDGVG